jgi:hypothetical protein
MPMVPIVPVLAAMSAIMATIVTSGTAMRSTTSNDATRASESVVVVGMVCHWFQYAGTSYSDIGFDRSVFDAEPFRFRRQ